jgi:DNA ligase-associated metallophosphoesterase
MNPAFSGTAPAPVLTLAGHAFEPDLSGALWWAERSTLVVADLHFEKATALAARRRGPLLPPYDTAATLLRLAAVVERRQPRIVISLGDAFHDAGGPDRLDAAAVAAIARLAAGRTWIWVAGNHDERARAPGPGQTVAELTTDGVAFRHQPTRHPPIGAAEPEIVGHYHPKATVMTGRGRVTGRCFAGDARRLVLPAFGAYAGGLDVLDPAIRGLFPSRFAIGLIGRRRVHSFPHETLVRVAA